MKAKKSSHSNRSEAAGGIPDNSYYQKPHSITESVTIFLREAILSGRMKPGQKIIETEIAEKLNVSRSPIREALRTVAKEDLVMLSPRKGAVVAEISVRELKEILEVREMIELFAVDLIERHRVTDFEGMRKTLNVDLVRLRQLDIGQSLNEVTKFHVALVRAAGNAKLCELYRALTNSLIRYQRIAAIIPDRMELSVEEHGRILDAFCRGRFDEAKELVRKHIEAFRPKTLQESDLSSLERAGQQRG